MRDESGTGTNAVLCHFAIGKLLEKLPARERFILLEVTDLRGRACGVNFGTGMPLKASDPDVGPRAGWPPHKSGRGLGKPDYRYSL